MHFTAVTLTVLLIPLLLLLQQTTPSREEENSSSFYQLDDSTTERNYGRRNITDRSDCQQSHRRSLQLSSVTDGIHRQHMSLLLQKERELISKLSPEKQTQLLGLHPIQMRQVLIQHTQHHIVTSQQSTAKRRAFIHIGPPKTGSSYIQHVLKTSESYLELKGYNLMLRNSFEFRDNARFTEVHPVTDFVRQSYASGRNIIYSSEELASLVYAGMEKVRSAFSLYDVKVIIIHRELGTRVQSAYNHHARRSERMIPLLSVLTNATERGRFTTESMIDSFSKAFGLENIVVLDYYGMLAAGKDEGDVILCEVIGVLCKNTKNKSGAVSFENAAADLNLLQLLDDIFQFGEDTRKCVRAGEGKSEQQTLEIISELKSELVKTRRSLPTRNISLDEILPKLRAVGRSLREKYGSIIMYGDEDANDAARSSISNIEIDRDRLRNEKFWREFMRQSSFVMENRNWLVKCSS